MSVAAFYLLKGRFEEFAKRTLTVGLIFSFCASLMAGIAGDDQARLLATTQPPKLAAFEGHYTTEKTGTGLYVFGIPNEKEKRVDYGLQIPGMLSFLVYFNFDKPVTALDKFPETDWPPVAIPFTAFHLMVALGGYFVMITSLGLFLLWKKKLFECRWMLWILVFSVIGPFIANEAGWVSAEVGRQPWVVYGLLRTKDAVSLGLPAHHVLVSIIAFSFVYILLFMVWVNVLHTKLTHGPDPIAVGPAGTGGFIEGATERADPSGPSMTEAKQTPPKDI